MSWDAYIDESIRRPGSPDGRYVMVASVLQRDTSDVARLAMAGLRVGKHARFHWRPSAFDLRRNAIATVCDLDVLHVVVIGKPVLDERKQERARRKVLERLLYELDTAGVSHSCFEARAAALNRRDRTAIDAWRSQGTISSEMRVDHRRPNDEPLLWVPDVVAGAVNAEDPKHWEQLEPLTTAHIVELS